ncbi:uncharacterized protein KIAA0513 [Parasteatoda tepidariorum]|uniref:uncharacterized protein KIAA0513 n=1 Tax=Parasteatoda tepidariorum TaxID=114398 RepID=UPI000A2C0375|nr:uncharacterized protein KIAA0513 [Parasteatoda tepidariorum]XP_042905882.1 uncharacterized protein KIAA0513 [Parasteatoda tepidariorum]
MSSESLPGHSTENRSIPDTDKRPQSFFSSVFSSHNTFNHKKLFTTANDDKQWKSEKCQNFLSSVIGSNQGLLSDLSSKIEAALSLNLDDSDTSSKSDNSCKHSTVDNVSNSSSQTDVQRVSFTKTERVSRHRYTKRKGHKDRSVYGQPEVNSFDLKQKSWKDYSQESLDTVDSGQSLGNCSNSSANADYKSSRNDPLYVFRRPESIGIGSESDPCEQSTDSSDAESLTENFGKSASGTSLQSWASSNDSQTDDLTLEFMKMFVRKIFSNGSSITFEEKAKFGELCQCEIGRLWFSRCVNSQRVHNKLVKESTFFSLVQYFAIVLFECSEADDFSPAKSLMNMCFTFYYERCRDGRPPSREYLFNYLRDQPIWRSVRFWNAAFFDAVQCERANRRIPTRGDLKQYSNEDLIDEKNFQRNIVFGQLGTFTYNMYAFGLSKEFSLEFLQKQCAIASLSKEHIDLLRENIDRMYSGDANKES